MKYCLPSTREINAPFGMIVYPSSLLSKYGSRITKSTVCGRSSFLCKLESKNLLKCLIQKITHIVFVYIIYDI